MKPYLKKPYPNKAGGVAQGEGPECKPQNHKKRKKRKEIFNQFLPLRRSLLLEDHFKDSNLECEK
jgi:hypothetical protein